MRVAKAQTSPMSIQNGSPINKPAENSSLYEPMTLAFFFFLQKSFYITCVYIYITPVFNLNSF